jgi:hypothetical protein
MIEWLGIAYSFAKDLGDFLKFKEDDKLIDRSWVEKSGFRAELEQRGYKLYWSLPEKVASRLIDGWEPVFEVDKLKRVRYRITLKDGSVLIGKMKESGE